MRLTRSISATEYLGYISNQTDIPSKPFNIDGNFLQEMGLGSLHPRDKARVLIDILKTYLGGVADRLAEQMTQRQGEEAMLLGSIGNEDSERLSLELYIPNYREIVASAYTEIKAAVAQIMLDMSADSQEEAKER